MPKTRIEEFEYISSKEASITVSYIDEETKKKIKLKGIVKEEEQE